MLITALENPSPGASSYRLAWTATSAAGDALGSAYLRVLTHAGAGHRTELELTVEPAARRRGVGSALLATAAAAARELGRRTMTVGPVEDGSPGAAFLTARDLRPVLRLTFARLALTDADGPAAPVAPPPGYRLVSWEGTVSDELAATFAASRRAMDDMPMDEADVGVETWDVERVRAVAAAVTDRGDVLCTVAAVDESDGSIVGFTETVVAGPGTGDAQHYGTGVLPGHRGRGLARCLKVAAIRHTREHHSQVTGLLTDTADTNIAMRRVNDTLGYRPTHRSVLFQLDLHPAP